jgi:hypothetical protein
MVGQQPCVVGLIENFGESTMVINGKITIIIIFVIHIRRVEEQERAFAGILDQFVEVSAGTYRV